MADTKLRLLHIADIFMHRTDSEHRLSVPALIDELSKLGIKAERKTIYRDIDALRGFGFEICSSSTGYYLRQHEFTLSDIKLLLAAVQNASFITKSTEEKLSKKLLLQLTSQNAEELSKYKAMLSVKEKTNDCFASLDTINCAIAASKQISYTDGLVNIRKRVAPYAVFSTCDGLFLACTSDDEDGFLLLDIRTMHSIALDSLPLPTPCTPLPSDNDSIKAFLNTSGTAPISIKLKCALHTQAAFINKFGNLAKFSKDMGSTFIVTVTVSLSDSLITWLAQFGSDVEILSPDTLRFTMHNFFESAIKIYQ
ncbi:MAG: WYL domain-containing protein [Clostridia bacterium]|nr:WYL domain-containing protein [Clostridia bacterium]